MSSVISTPITFPLSLTMFAAKKTSIPAPEPKSTTVSPSFIWANFTGLPHPTPKMDDSGMDSRSLVLYLIDSIEEDKEEFSLFSVLGLQQLEDDDDKDKDDEGIQQESEFPINTILLYF